ncbi:citramalate synthase [Candidatus Woesearchaeota archaeon]|nr:citramalate synthase [Candidatus Woesearchaeota archaeon]
MAPQIIIYDTLLRDGCQSASINFSVQDKLAIAQALDDFGVDYIELGWPSASQREMEVFSEAKKLSLKHSRIVAFGSTKRKNASAGEDGNLQGIIASGAKTACIFGKTWKQHVEKQLGITPEENLTSIEESIAFLKSKNLEVFYDLEHFFDGFKDNEVYALACIRAASMGGAAFAVLCDTNGGTMTDELVGTIETVKSFIQKENLPIKLGIHCHNDCGIGVANSLAAVNRGVEMVQGTMNGFGERIGNADLTQIIPNLILKKGVILPSIRLEKLTQLSNRIYSLANAKPDPKKPFVGKEAFSHKGGVHVDAIVKGASYEHIDPAAVGNKREVILSDLSGKANVLEILRKFSIATSKEDPRVKAMLRDVEAMENKGYDMGTIYAEQFLLKEKHFGNKSNIIVVTDWKILSGRKEGEYSECYLKAKINDEEHEATRKVQGGPVDAFFHALKDIAGPFGGPKEMKLTNYKVVIAEDQGPSSSVRVYIEFKNNDEEFGTVGVSTNILEASLEALQKAFSYCLLRNDGR